MAKKFDYTILELIESSARNFKAQPLNLGAVGGGGGGAGSPPGGYIGQLPQYRVAYDVTESATLSTLPSGLTGASGWSLVDNLNHIRYRLGQLEISSGILIVDEYDGSPSISNVNRITFSGAIITDLGGGHALVQVTASGGSSTLDGLTDVTISGLTDGDILVYSGAIGQWVNIQPQLDAPFDGQTYGRKDGDWVAISGVVASGGAALTVMDFDGSPTITNVDTIRFSGAIITDLGSGDVLVAFSGGASESTLHYYNDDLTSQVPSDVFTTSRVYASGTLRVYYNGIRQRKGVHYVDDINFTTFSTYFTTSSGDVMIVDFDYLQQEQTFLSDSNGMLITDSDGNQLV